MDYIYVGEVTNTHGLKGEIRIISDFEFKNKVFIQDMILYLGKRKQPQTINTYRVHKNYDMVTFDGIDDINEAIVFKGDSVYIKRNSIEIDGYLNEDLIGLNVIAENKIIGTISKIMKSVAHDILVVENKKHQSLIPYVSEFVKKIDLNNKIIEINVIEGLLNED